MNPHAGTVTGDPTATDCHEACRLAHGEKVVLQSERKDIRLDPAVLSRYVGAYQMPQGAAMLITLEGSQLVSKLGPQPPVSIFPESETAFFAKVLDAQIEFPASGQGKATQMTLRQFGRDIIAPRLGDEETKRIADSAAAAPRDSRTRRPRPVVRASPAGRWKNCEPVHRVTIA